MGNELIATDKNRAVSVLKHTDLSDIIKPMIREIHLFDTYVAGTTHLKDRSVLDAVRVGDELVLRREDNEYDKNAILVLGAQNKKLGYVPEKDNVVFSRLMDAGKKLSAKISKIEPKSERFTAIEIGIYLIDL
ncbi:MAG: HIRAN domain-containing protein [Clostridia bacterium]|nr:HIRAN domain-containing protein [Clostridia bacterium]